MLVSIGAKVASKALQVQARTIDDHTPCLFRCFCTIGNHIAWDHFTIDVTGAALALAIASSQCTVALRSLVVELASMSLQRRRRFFEPPLR